MRVERSATVVGHKAQGVGRGGLPAARYEPATHVRPESGDGLEALGSCEQPAVGLVAGDECGEGIACQRAREVGVVVDAHEVVVLESERVAANMGTVGKDMLCHKWAQNINYL